MEHRITSTYRLQFSGEFRFADAERIVDYLADLGVTAMYASPYFRARAGSTHGYDVVDHNAINPDVGTADEHGRMIAAAQARGLSHLLDFVPNHMGVAITNPWWADVLEWGERSPYANYFDVEWHPQRTDLKGKVLLPFLGDHYGRVLEAGDITPVFEPDRGTFSFAYYERRFPLRPSSYAPILISAAHLCPSREDELTELAKAFAAIYPAWNAEQAAPLRAKVAELKARLADLASNDARVTSAIENALDAWRVRPDDPAGVERLELMLSRQHYRLAFWRVALYEINYRRFFDINDLVGLRVEDAEVLQATHRLLFDLIDRGLVQGVRIDHVDGLFQPASYLRFLRQRATFAGRPFYLIVEKILAYFEYLREDWNVDGTTGYDFMNLVNGLFVNPRSELAFDRIYASYAPTEETYEAIVYASKQHVIHNKLASELAVLSDRLFKITRQDRRSNDFTYDGLREALASMVASFPVYRTYVTGDGATAEDRQFIEIARTLASKRSEVLDQSVFDFITSVLSTDVSDGSTRYDPADVLEFAMKFQQFTAPVMAKSVEDTAFYRYVRLISLNEVGGDPRRFGTSVSAFHHHNRQRAQRFPTAMLSTATHDHKRGEDTRLRIDALSEMPGRWRRAMRRFSRIAGGAYVDSERAPSFNDTYAL
ncbi:MAG TPA: malto-oligosyltrehalose synthase, partial [Candidatus Baltobacteraceae bacterium]|nr:malto-oligosyltrehalose synthase [Candidatus Baltobacteraceae bacterium]